MATTVRKPPQTAERLIAEALRQQSAFFDAARRPSEEFLRIAVDVPGGFDPLEVEKIRDAQLAYQDRFQRASAGRLRSGLREAMAKPTRLTIVRALRARQRDATDPDVKARLQQQIEAARAGPDARREHVAKVLEKERRYALAHATALAGRARGVNRATQVRTESPTGALWRRNPESDSCERCRFMDGKLWPWEVLDRFSPPVHPNCQCQLIPVGAARHNGWVGPKVQMPTAKQGIQRARRVLQESVAGAILVEAVRRGLFREPDVVRDWRGRFAPEHGSVGAPPTSSPIRFRNRHEKTRFGGIERHPALGYAAHTAHPTGPPKPPGYVSPSRQWLDRNAEDGFQADPLAMDFSEFLGEWRYEGVTTELRRARMQAGVPVIEGLFIRDGETIGNFKYGFRSKQRRLRFDEIVLEGQGGVGTKFAREVINRARDDDRIDSVDLEAGYSAGGYVWAREGAQPISPDWSKDVLNQQFDRVLKEMVSEDVPEAKDLMRGLRKRMKKGDFPTVQDLAAWGREHAWKRDVKGREVTMWPGKALLAGSSYRASFNTRTLVTEMLSGMELFDLSTVMGLSLPPDEPDADDREFWDRAEGLAEEIVRNKRRGHEGEFAKTPGVSVGRRFSAGSVVPDRPEPETRLATGYAQAAEILAQGYREKVDRRVEEGAAGMVGAYEFLTTPATSQGIEGTLELAGYDVRISRYGWDTGDTMFTMDAFGENGRLRNAKDPDLRAGLLADLRAAAEKVKAPMLDTQRKNIRGAVMSPTTEKGRDAYAGLAEAQAENAAEPVYADLRKRFADVPERVIVVDEKGYGRFPLGVADVMVTASRNLDHQATTVNGLAISTAVRMARESNLDSPYNWNTGVGSRGVQLKPGTDHITVRSTAALLRHEWGHGLYDALPPEKRQEFMDMLPQREGGIDWDAVGGGLSKYAAGNVESRADYDQRTSMIGKYGYSTETFAEAVALVGGSDYVPGEWPEWVQNVGEWIERLEP